MALTFEQEAALLALLDEKRITLPELAATAEIKADDLLLTNQLLVDKSVTAKVLKDYIAPQASTKQIGIVQLSSATDSESEVIAATSKAIKNVGFGRLINIQTFTGSDNYIPTPGTKDIEVIVIGAGGAGGGTQATASNQASAGGGGGAGGVAISYFKNVQFESVSVVVGKGGSSVVGNSGGDGGTTSFGNYLSATGGVGGAYSTPTSSIGQSAGGQGGLGIGGNILSAYGGAGLCGLVTVVGNAVSGSGGNSYFSAGAPRAYGVQHGFQGVIGSGGGGGISQYYSCEHAGGHGGHGFVIIREYA